MGFNLAGMFPPNFQHSLVAKTICEIQKALERCKNGKDLLYHHASMVRLTL